MAGLLSSLFGSDSSDTESQSARVPVSSLDQHDDDGGQGAQSYDDSSADNAVTAGDDGGAGAVSVTPGPPTDAYLSPQSGEGDAHGF